MTVMRFMAAILFALTILAAGKAEASLAEVRDVALNNNCQPKKIEVYKQSLGSEGRIIYRVQCALPKTVGPAPEGDLKPPDALLVMCNQNLCSPMRSALLEK
jgi:hypothetical protein